MSEDFCDLIQPIRIMTIDFDSRKGKRCFILLSAQNESGGHTYPFLCCHVAGIFKLVTLQPRLRMRGFVPSLTHNSEGVVLD
jgi:hypothetical protein